MITITKNAAIQIKYLLEKDQKSLKKYGLRLGVMGGGCSGFQYIMEFDTEGDDDHVFSYDDIQVFIDPRSLEYLDGSHLDYQETLMGSGFKVINPKEKGSCGCGHSFTV